MGNPEAGRNDPCPCGSGKKYKKCCLAAAEGFEARRREELEALDVAFDWLHEKFPEEVSAAMDFFCFAGFDEKETARLRELPESYVSMLRINLNDWLIADASLEVDGELVRIRDLLLRPGGPELSGAGRNWLMALGENPLSLFEVLEVTPGASLKVLDLLDTRGAEYLVHERSASKSLVRWDTLGARIAVQDGHYVFSGSVYPMDRETAQDCVKAVKDLTRGVKRDREEVRLRTAFVISSIWRKSLVEVREMPTLVDMSTGDPILLVNDHYRVNDWISLEESLAKQHDVEGDREDGWVRFVVAKDGTQRLKAALNPEGGDKLVLFTRTMNLADEARLWFDKVTGKSVTYRTREVMDPRSEKALSGKRSAKPASEASPEVEDAMVKELLLRHYANWADEPIPALGGKTPKQAVKTAKGEKAVIELLKSYELMEERRVHETGVAPFDYGFLWEKVGIERP